MKACGKGNEVENLMKGMLEDVQLLACEHGMKTAAQAQQEQIVKAIEELLAVAPSVPEGIFQETSFTANNYGSGTQTYYHAQSEAQQNNSAGGPIHNYSAPGGTMNFGKN